ncbi:MAG: hypothetical protein AAGK04_05805 [Planctomycetota bacterium]
MTIRAQDLEAELWTPIARLDRDALTEAWRQTHYAAQAVVEVGKSWGEPSDDHSHSAMLFDPEDETWCSLASDAFGPVRGRLDIGSGVVTVDRDEPNEGAWIDPTGLSLAQLSAWTRESTQRLTGAGERQTSVPAPDLPDHALSGGASFDLEDTETLADLDTLYAFTAHMLHRLALTQRGRVVDGEHELTPRLWPHHFDAASLCVLARDADGSMTSTIGVGLTPPDDTDEWGYWYVSPWRRQPGATRDENETIVPLDRGRWIDRGDTSMAVLPVSVVTRLDDPGEQSKLVAEFVASAFNICMEQLV